MTDCCDMCATNRAAWDHIAADHAAGVEQPKPVGWPTDDQIDHAANQATTDQAFREAGLA